MYYKFITAYNFSCRFWEHKISSSWDGRPFDYNRHWPKIRDCADFFLGGGRPGSPCNTMRPGPRLTFVPSGILIHSAVWPQHMGRNWGLCPLGRGGAGSPSNTTLGRGLPSHQVASWSIQPYGLNKHGPEIGGSAPFGEGELGPHLKQYHLGRGLLSHQVAFWSIQPFGHTRHGPKICEGALAPFWGGGAVFPSNTMSLGSRPIFLPSGILNHGAIWPQ